MTREEEEKKNQTIEEEKTHRKRNTEWENYQTERESIQITE